MKFSLRMNQSVCECVAVLVLHLNVLGYFLNKSKDKLGVFTQQFMHRQLGSVQPNCWTPFLSVFFLLSNIRILRVIVVRSSIPLYKAKW